MELNPNLSVLLPVYNAEKYVFKSIESVLNQSFSNFELIIINDCSTDNSEIEILKFEDKRILYFKNSQNLKLIETLNFGLSIAQGKYIARIDADDICFPQRFEKQVAFLENNVDYGLVGSFAETFGEKNEVLKYSEEDIDIRYGLLTHNPFVHSTIMLRSSILSDFRLQYDKDQLHVEDYDLWIRMLKHCKGKILPEVLVEYRLHSEQVSKLFSNLQLKNVKNIQINYLIQLGFHYHEIEIIHSLLNYLPLENFRLIHLLGEIKSIGYKLPFVEKQKIFSKTLQRLIKNQLFDKKQFTLTEIILLTSKKEFTIKQKIAFLLKISFRHKIK